MSWNDEQHGRGRRALQRHVQFILCSRRLKVLIHHEGRPGACLEILLLLTPGLDNTRLFMSLTAGAGTRSMVISLHYQALTIDQPCSTEAGKPRNRILCPKTNVSIRHEEYNSFKADGY